MSTVQTFLVGQMRPQMDARNLEGNTFAIAARVRQTLEHAGLHNQAKLVIPAMTSSASQSEAIAKFMEMVDFIWSTPKSIPVPRANEPQLPAGTYIVADPCYVLKDDAYDVLLAQGDWSGDTPSIVGGVTCWIMPTANGDGTYEGDSPIPQWNPGRFAVDSGHIAIIQVNEAVFASHWHNVVDGILDIRQAFKCEIDEDDTMIFGNFLTIPTRAKICPACGDRYCDETCQDEPDEDEDEDEE